MKHRRLWLFVLGFVFLAVLIAMMFTRESEPVYQARTLSYWLNRATSHSSLSIEELERFHEEESAIRHIGTNAIPSLLRMARKKDWPFQNRWNDMLRKRNLHKWYIRDAEQSRARAAEGFSILGAQAAPAIPELIKLLDDKDANVRLCAAESLGVLSDSGRSAMKEVVPALIRHLYEPNDLMRFATSAALGRMQSYPDLVVPPLLSKLGSHKLKRADLYLTLSVLDNMGTNANAAVPVMKKYATNSDAYASKIAQDALSKLTNSTPNPH